MESTVVIKVKYGGTLRRFNALLEKNKQLDLDMGRLREKVLNLFNLTFDADLTLTYIDEDGDVVTLVDEDDLLDVVRQGLNPLRITVTLNTEKGARSYERSSGSSTRMKSPRVQHPLPSLDTTVAEILKSIPVPFREALPKLSLDLATRAASSELVHRFLKMGHFHLNPVPEIQAALESSTHSGASGSTTGASGATKDPEVSKDDGATSEMLPNAKLEGPTNAKPEEPTPQKSQEVDSGNITCGIWASIMRDMGSLNLNVEDPEVSKDDGATSEVLPNAKLEGPTNAKPEEPTPQKNQEVDSGNVTYDIGSLVPCVPPDKFHWRGKSPSFASVNPKPFVPYAPLSKNNKVMKSRVGQKSLGVGAFPSPPFLLVDRSYNYSDGMGGIFHRGIRCDGCGVHPISGPRFKSKIKENYDLCSICYSEMGIEVDYIRIDHPMSFRHPWSSKGLYDPMQNNPMHPRMLRSNLDSHFIRDVNVLDGTVMAPSTSFTKIWRMRNNGTVVWPQGTQLVWIGGDKLSDNLSVEVEIPVNGLPADMELDISVNFTAPDLPGQYISYWRMALPYGPKFGKCVWVLIQVDVAVRDSLGDNFHGWNLNLPPESNGMTIPENINVCVESMVDDSLLEPGNSDKAAKSVQATVDEQLKDYPERNFPSNDTLLVGGGFSSPFPPKATTVSSPIVYFPEVAPTAPSPVTINMPPSAQELSGNNDVEQTLLKELEEMGFKQVDLNKEVLRMNEYNLEQSVDDLCCVAQWDPILEELEEMGFCDEEKNKRLLKKNNGSLKHVVMDLVAGEEA